MKLECLTNGKIKKDLDIEDGTKILSCTQLQCFEFTVLEVRSRHEDRKQGKEDVHLGIGWGEIL
jgi:hypothetical protein